MSTYEVKDEIKNKNIPNGFKIIFHQIRGYDSPDKWYEVWYCGKLVGEFYSESEAIKACKHKRNRKC